MFPAGSTPQRGSDPGAPPAPAQGLRSRRVFDGEERQLGVLRRWLASLLPDCPARDDLACVATELGANAVRHTATGRGGWFIVEVTWLRPAVRVAVSDCGAPDGPRVIDDPAGEHGRGLLVVRGLSVRTGVCGDHRGRLVWADIPWREGGTGDSSPPQYPHQAVIRDGLAGLASRFPGVTAWFGCSTSQWWAEAGGTLVAASTAQELAGLLSHALPQPQPPAVRGAAAADARGAPAGRRERRPGAPAPGPRPGRAPLPGDGRERTGPGAAPGIWASRQDVAGVLACGPAPAARYSD